MMKISKKLRGFSLMEVLVSASIFAMVMVIATGVLGTSSQMRTKIDEVKLNSQEGSKLADLITNDVRAANVSGTVVSDSLTKTMRSGLALLYCANKNFNNCVFINSDDEILFPKVGADIGLNGLNGNSVSNGNDTANVLVAFNKSEIKVFYSDKRGPTYETYYKSFPYSETFDLSEKSGEITAEAAMLNSNKVEEKLVMTGFAPSNSSSINQQPYVRFFIQTKTKGAEAGKENTFELRSWVTARYY